MSQPMLTMCATTRCATKPGAVADRPTPARRRARAGACAASRIAGGRRGRRHQRAALVEAEQAVHARPCASGRCPPRARRVVASWPSGATRHSESGPGPVAAVEARAELRRPSPRVVVQAVRARPRPSGIGASGTGATGIGCARRRRTRRSPRLLRLAAEQPGDDALRRDRRGAIARLLVVLVVDRLHHRVRHVEPGQVEELERPHAEAGAIAQAAVDLAELGDAFAQRMRAPRCRSRGRRD